MQSERESSNYLQDARGSTSQDTDAGDAWFEGSRQPGRSYEAGLMIYWSGAAKTSRIDYSSDDRRQKQVEKIYGSNRIREKKKKKKKKKSMKVWRSVSLPLS